MSKTAWVKSTRCESAHCFEAADLGATTKAVRNSTEPDTHLTFTGRPWAAFLAGVRRGEFSI